MVLAITLHEAAHGYAARSFGDRTAERLGRISLNPLRHIDPIGTLLVPGIMILAAATLGGPPWIFGWAKPVPVNFGNLRHPKRDMLWVAAAGPAANFAMALAWAIGLRLATLPGPWPHDALFEMSRIGISINLVLMALNLIPIPPLDGGRIAVSLLPAPLAGAWQRLERYGFVIIVALLVTGLLNQLMLPFLRFGEYLLGVLPGIR